MEDIYPEIALKQPKADPRTVLLHKRNFMECSSDHIQDFYSNSINNSTTTTAAAAANCDKTKNMYKYTTTTNANKCSATATLASKTSLESVSASASPVSSTLSSSSNSTTSSSLLLHTTIPSSSSSSSSSLSNILVNFSKSCHFNASFNNNKNNLYKTQTKTKLIFFLLFILCAILIQTTQALPARRVTTSGRKLILHTNVYRERYHQKLLEEQRQHNQHQQQLQLQLQLQEQQLQQQLQRQQQLLSHPPSIHLLQQQSQPQQHQQVQKNHIFSPSQILRRHPQPQPHHRHHLHQRAAPVTTTRHHLQQRHKMSYCDSNQIYRTLHQQMNASMNYIKQLCASYLRDRGNETFENMSETWKLISLETRNPNRQPASIDNDLHREIHEFYLNLHSFEQLIDYATQDTTDNKTTIEHGEEVEIEKILEFFRLVKHEVKVSMGEAGNLLENLDIEKPNLADNAVEFNYNLGRRVRDFLIIKDLIEEFDRILKLVQDFCETNEVE